MGQSGNTQSRIFIWKQISVFWEGPRKYNGFLLILWFGLWSTSAAGPHVAALQSITHETILARLEQHTSNANMQQHNKVLMFWLDDHETFPTYHSPGDLEVKNDIVQWSVSLHNCINNQVGYRHLECQFIFPSVSITKRAEVRQTIQHCSRRQSLYYMFTWLRKSKSTLHFCNKLL